MTNKLKYFIGNWKMFGDFTSYKIVNKINQYIYNDVSGLSWILFVMCIHVPISMLFGVVVSLYRSVLKIKEIVLYGTFITVTLRAILTFIIFQFTDEILHFILIEVFTQILVLSILLYLFNKNEQELIPLFYFIHIFFLFY